MQNWDRRIINKMSLDDDDDDDYHICAAAIAAYNTGRSRVHGWHNIDSYTTGHDYSNDVIARAQRLKNHYGWS